MYVAVRLLNGFETPFLYKVPESLQNVIRIGAVVKVPLRNMLQSALVEQILPQPWDNANYKIKEIIGLEPFPDDLNYQKFIKTLSRFYFVPQLHFYQRVKKFLQDKKVEDNAHCLNTHDEIATKEVQLTAEQNTVYEYLRVFIEKPEYAPTLLHGVTGSGKTEVYKALIKDAVAANKTTVLLLPEVSLAMQFQILLTLSLPEVTVHGFHSATKINEKRQLWHDLISGRPILIIGVHLPILLPIKNLGLIIVDEEHEQGFLEKRHPKINSKDAALWRASIYKIPILLGSATPSVLSFYNVERHGWKFFKMTKRFAGTFPEVQVVDLIDASKRRRSVFWITQELQDAIKQCLSEKRQAIIYINRRGYSFFVQCKECGFVFECPNCSVSLTLHAERDVLLRCHYCDHKRDMPKKCSGCGASEKSLLKKGIGTQQAVKLLQDLFPHAVIERADLDSTSKKRHWENTVKLFSAGEIDILVGTQTITKGYHFPGVTLVGILWADLNLHFPVYNASEVTLQQLIQVAGRAGRQHANSRVIVQKMQTHQIFNYLNEQNYADFCCVEMEMRKESGYPPFGRLAQIELKNNDAGQVQMDAERLGEMLRSYNQQNGLNVVVMGPAFPVIHKIQNTQIRHIFLKSQSFKNIFELLSNIDFNNFKSSVFIVSSL